jgi:hypothetical protein
VRRKHSCAHRVTVRRMQQPAHSGQRAMYRSPRANEPADVRQLATSAISGEKCGLRQALSIQQMPRATYNHAPERLTSSRAASHAMSSCSSKWVYFAAHGTAGKWARPPGHFDASLNFGSARPHTCTRNAERRTQGRTNA